jgi:uncharacterized protein YggE
MGISFPGFYQPLEDDSMKPTVNLFNLVLMGLAVLLAPIAWQRMATGATPAQAALTAPAGAPGAGSCDSHRSVQVSGAAIVYVAPDRALLQLGVQSNGASPDAVQSANLQEMQKVINAVRSLGVEAKDIATDYYIVYPVYEDYSAMTIKGYRIDNTVSITLRDVKLAGDVILAALKAGANEVQDVQFYSSELRKFRDQARELAMKAAGEKAQALAGVAGAQADCVLTVSENSWAQYYGSWRGGRETALWAQNTVQNASSSQGAAQDATGSDDSPVSLGQIAVRAEVSATYSLR